MRFDRIAYLRLNCLFSLQFLSENRFTLFGNCSLKFRVVEEMNAPLATSGRGVTAVLGPTNTGKTHLAIERMLAHPSGVIGLPLRLLAREVYDRICARIGHDKVSLITGEEKILSLGAPYRVCTVEAMGRETGAAFVAIDEVQLAADFERGHIFTDRLLHLRGAQETMLLGAATMRPILERLMPKIEVQTRPRLSQLTYRGAKKISRLPPRSCIVAFSADEVYAIAEFIRRQRGGAAVVLGSLSPRSRNAQVALYQAGEVDFLVATDAVGMGLNLDVDHVAFAQTRKFDGYQHRFLNAAELGQIAGRAGRFSRDGTFGVTGRVEPFDAGLVARLEGHNFAPVKLLQWRTAQFDFTSITALQRSLEQNAPMEGLARALPATDARALALLSRDEEIRDLAGSEGAVRLLWDVCALPDYLKIAPAQHADIIAILYRDLMRYGCVDEDYLARQVALVDNIEGDIDTLSHRIAHIRSWTYVANRRDWLKNPEFWQEKTRSVEDKLSDALHQCLTQRFVNRTTGILMKRLRENAMIEAEIAQDGNVLVEGHVIGQLQGFRFTPTDRGAMNALDAKALREAAQKALVSEYEARANRFAICANGDLAIGSDAVVRWLGSAVASVVEGAEFLLPKVILLADEQLVAPARDKVIERLQRFVTYHFETSLKPLFDLVALQASGQASGQSSSNATILSGSGRGLAYQLVEKQGCIKRCDVADMIKGQEPQDRNLLRDCGVRFGTYHIFIPSLLKPVPAQALTLLWALKHDAIKTSGYGDIVAACAAGRTSLVVDASFNPHFYRLAGYRIFGRRAVRLDSLEKLADLIRQALNWREGETKGARPVAAYDARQFLVSPQMLSSLGVSHADMEEILKALGYRCHNVTMAQIAQKHAPLKPALPAAECVGPVWNERVSDVPPAEPVGAVPSENLVDSVKPVDKETRSEKTVQLWHYHHKRAEGRRRTSRAIKQPQQQEKQADEARKDGARKPKRQQARFDRKDFDRKDQEKQHHHLKSGENKRKDHHKYKDNKQRDNRPARTPMPLDPDSPFAKLAALRDKLKIK